MFGERTQEERSGADWLNKGEGGTEIGWGRRIYDKNEIEVRERDKVRIRTRLSCSSHK